MMGPGFGHMFGYGYGYGNALWWMIGFGVLRLIITIVIVVYAIKLISKYINKRETVNTSWKAIEILKERYATGEISEEEYERKLKILKG